MGSKPDGEASLTNRARLGNVAPDYRSGSPQRTFRWLVVYRLPVPLPLLFLVLPRLRRQRLIQQFDGDIFYTFDERGNVSERLDSAGYLVTRVVTDAYGKSQLFQAGIFSDTTYLTDPYIGYNAQHGYYKDSETGPLPLYVPILRPDKRTVPQP